MSALFELQNGMTTEEAMLRGMEFGWSQVFASAQSENSINSLKANSREIEMFGTGIHALQDAYAHHGSHMDESVGGIVSHIHNDMTNKPDMAKAQKITTSAITVYELMTNDFSSLSKKQVFNIATTGMNSTQLMGLFQQIHRYLAYEKPKKEK